MLNGATEEAQQIERDQAFPFTTDQEKYALAKTKFSFREQQFKTLCFLHEVLKKEIFSDSNATESYNKLVTIYGILDK